MIEEIGPVTESMIESSEVIEGNLFCKVCSNEDFEIVNKFIGISKEENLPFLSVYPGDQNALLLIDQSKNEFLGFLVWMKDPMDEKYLKSQGEDVDLHKHMCCGETLQIIYIIEEERRKGLASKLIKYWVESYANKTHDRFGVEKLMGSPIVDVLIKLGYAKRTDDGQLTDLKFYFTESS